MSDELSDAVLARIKEALADGMKINAIKIYRGCTGSDLTTAKQAVEDIAAGLSPPSGDVADDGSAATSKTPSEAEAAAISDALSQGRKIEAIRLLREQTGMGLKEAKEAIEALELKLGLAPDPDDPLNQVKKGGCLVVLALLLPLSVSAVWLACWTVSHIS